MKRFRARLEPVPHGGCFVVVSAPHAAAAGLVFRDRVRGTVDGAAFRSSLAKYSGVFHLGIPKASLKLAGATLGDRVAIAIERDPEPLPGDTVPQDLAKALRQAKATAAFEALTPSHRRTHVDRVLAAKKPETRARRIAAVVAWLAATARPPRRRRPR